MRRAEPSHECLSVAIITRPRSSYPPQYSKFEYDGISPQITPLRHVKCDRSIAIIAPSPIRLGRNQVMPLWHVHSFPVKSTPIVETLASIISFPVASRSLSSEPDIRNISSDFDEPGLHDQVTHAIFPLEMRSLDAV